MDSTGRTPAHETDSRATESPRLIWNAPNSITGLRVILAAGIAYLLYLAEPHTITVAGVLLLFAAFTDTIDGFLARRLGQGTLGGALFDLVADEILFMPAVILAIRAGLFDRADNLAPLNPYLYAVPALAGGVAVVSGVGIYVWKRRTRPMLFPSRPAVVQATYWFWLAALIAAVLRIGPDAFLAILMLLSLVFTLLSFYVYLKKGSYVFTE